MSVSLEFSKRGFLALQEKLSLERRGLLFREVSSHDGSFVLIRHDIDYCLEMALQAAHMEHDLGVKATYFVLLSCEYYNIFEKENRLRLKEINSLGHEIGLHYDIEAMDLDSLQDTGCEELDFQALILSELVDRKVQSVALHNPSMLTGTDPLRGKHNYVDAYDDRWFKDIPYYSDSAVAFRDRAYDALSKGEFPQQFQLLLHPMCWFTAGLTGQEKLRSFFDGRNNALDLKYLGVSQGWREHSGAQEHAAREKGQQKSSGKRA